MTITPTLAAAIAVDLLAVSILAGPLYFRRHRRRDLMLAYVALNVGVLGVAIALSGAQVGVGLGLGLFGVLSIVRLRSDQISQAEIAYYFSALALGLLCALGSGTLWMPAAFSAGLLIVHYVVDHPRLAATHQRQVITVDRAYVHDDDLRIALATLLGATIGRVEVIGTDLVRDTTTVDVRYRVVDRSRAGSGATTPPEAASALPWGPPAPAATPAPAVGPCR